MIKSKRKRIGVLSFIDIKKVYDNISHNHIIISFGFKRDVNFMLRSSNIDLQIGNSTHNQMNLGKNKNKNPLRCITRSSLSLTLFNLPIDHTSYIILYEKSEPDVTDSFFELCRQ